MSLRQLELRYGCGDVINSDCLSLCTSKHCFNLNRMNPDRLVRFPHQKIEEHQNLYPHCPIRHLNCLPRLLVHTKLGVSAHPLRCEHRILSH
jgi:hypothetical protein